MCLYCDEPGARGTDTCERHWLGPIEAVRIRHASRLVEIRDQYPGGVVYSNSRSPFLGWTIRVADQPVANVIMHLRDVTSGHRYHAQRVAAVVAHPRGEILAGLLGFLNPLGRLHDRQAGLNGLTELLAESALAQAEHGV